MDWKGKEFKGGMVYGLISMFHCLKVCQVTRQFSFSIVSL